MPHQFTFKKKEKLKSRKIIQQLFNKGKSFSVFPLRVIYLEQPEAIHYLQLAFSVSNKNFKKAVDRNKIKRLMRETYRLQNESLERSINLKEKNFSVFMIYTEKKLPEFNDLYEKMNRALKSLEQIIGSL